MTRHIIEPERLAELRSLAASRLKGAAATKGSPARAADALAVLHAWASSPATAADALALLHELQVHQVEVDMQAQELHESRAELESALRRQIELYDHQPVGLFTIDARLVVHELNQTGADMLGIDREDAGGMGLDTFLCADSARRLRSAIAGAGGRETRTACRLTLRPKGGAEQPVLASIGVDPAADRVFVSLVDAGDPQSPQPV